MCRYTLSVVCLCLHCHQNEAPLVNRNSLRKVNDFLPTINHVSVTIFIHQRGEKQHSPHVLTGSPRTITDRLQRLLNAAARVVSNIGKFDRGFTHLLHSELRWLDVPQRILHKLGVTVHRCLQGRAPQYLMNCCQPTSDVVSRQRLRSSSRHHLVIPQHRRSTLGRRAFSVAGPMAWNALRDDLRDPSLSADNFRKRLKRCIGFGMHLDTQCIRGVE